MTAFIKQEALEKSREIEIKADEEFAIEKSKLVRQEIQDIDLAYEKKYKAAEMSQQITRSTVANKTRLKILSAKQEILDQIFENVEKKLGDISQNHEKYENVLKNLLLEGMYALNEDKVVIRAKELDHEIVKSASKSASEEYKQIMDKDIQIVVDETNHLPSSRYVALAQEKHSLIPVT